MSDYYNAQRKRNIYEPGSTKPFKLSRSKLELFLNCARCFYLDRRLGVGQPPGYPFNLNTAVDTLLKKEFDGYRARKEAHPLMIEAGLDAIPFAHERLDEWRDSLRRGVQWHHVATNLLIAGGVDDVWQRSNGELVVVDYKATSKNGDVGIDADWQIGYKRQMSLYAWLFKQNGFAVSGTGYFVYCNGSTDCERFDKRLEFRISLIPYQIDDSWVEAAIAGAHACLNASQPPPHSDGCDYCAYINAVSKHSAGY